MKLTTLFICLLFLIHGCSHKHKKIKKLPKPVHFTSFEISYMGGWIGQFSFSVDSDKIYISPVMFGIRYGILPDSIFYKIDSAFLRIVSDTSIKSHDKGCYDCSTIAVKAISKNDTIRIYQHGDISKPFWPVVKSIEEFLDNVKHKSIVSWPYLETYKMVQPPPPPPIRFLEKKKSKK